MGIFRRIWKKVKEVGLRNCISGAILRAKYIRMQKKYGFEAWHLSPYEWRAYLQKTASYINAHGAETVVDIGCGLGSLLKHIEAVSRIGFDIHEEVILAARELGGKSVVYNVGTFGEVDMETAIDYLITLNFTHGGTEETWRAPYHAVAEKNDIKHFVVDTVPEDGPSHFLDYSKVLPQNYVLVERMGPFLGGRFVEVWEKQQL